ncbi:unnamed protein product, partial [marine sediment metagenome]
MKLQNIINYVPPYNLVKGDFDKRSKINKIGNIVYSIVGGLALWGSVFAGG